MEIPRLHSDVVDQVQQKADIVEVVSEYVVLRKRGKDLTGSCPFHDDKSPSFSVSPGKQLYYCFGCGAGGNVIKFLMELGKRSFSDVVLDLAQRYQVPIKTLEPEERQKLQQQISVRDQLYTVLALATRFYQHALQQPQGQAALEYTQSARRLSQETIQQFQLGYAPAGWEVLYGYLVKQKHFPVELVEQAGLIVPRKSAEGYYDRFRDRLVIPIHDLKGQVIGFGSRTLTNQEPKYLNSPETGLFNKSKVLFALDKARTAILKQDQAVVVEGYFDAISLHAAGITNVVASMGTALTLDQTRQLLRYTESKRIALNFDADSAGAKAAQRAIGEMQDLAYRGEVQLRILNLPEGKDADEFLKASSADHYQELLNTAPLWLDWQIQQVLVSQDLKQADEFQQATQQIVKLLGNLTNATLRTHYIHSCAEHLSHGDSRLAPLLEENLLAQVRRQRRRLLNGVEAERSRSFNAERFAVSAQPNRSRGVEEQVPLQPLPVSSEQNLLEPAESLLLRVYLHHPEHRQIVINALEERDLQFSLSHHRFLWRKILELQGEQPPSESDLIAQLQVYCVEFAREMAQISHLFHLDEKLEREILRPTLQIQATIASMERVICAKRYYHFVKLWKETDCFTHSQLCQFYQQQFDNEYQRIKELDQQRCVTGSDLAQLFQ